MNVIGMLRVILVPGAFIIKDLVSFKDNIIKFGVMLASVEFL